MPKKKKKSESFEVELDSVQVDNIKISKNMTIYLPNDYLKVRRKVVLTEGQRIEPGKDFTDYEIEYIKKAQSK